MPDPRDLRRQLEVAQAAAAAARRRAALEAERDAVALTAERETQALLRARERLGPELVQLEATRAEWERRLAGPLEPATAAPSPAPAPAWSFERTVQLIVGVAVGPVFDLIFRPAPPYRGDQPVAFWAVCLLLATTMLGAQLHEPRR